MDMNVALLVTTFGIMTTFTDAAPFSLCSYFVAGATCGPQCAFEAVHAWGIPLCHGITTGAKCCVPETHPLVQQSRKGDSGHKTTTTTTVATTIPTPTPASQPTTPSPPSCGQPRAHSRVRRIVGGSRAPPGVWPWQVALRSFTGGYLCGGTLISDKFVLTAAHCFVHSHDDPKYLRIHLGDQSLAYDKSNREKSVEISRIIKHEGFQRNVETVVNDPVTGNITNFTRHVHDIALVELQHVLPAATSSQPICLPFFGQAVDGGNDVTNTSGLNFTDSHRGNITGEEQMSITDIEMSDDCWVAGWGQTEDGDGGADLREVRGKVIDHEECGQLWGTSFTPDHVVCFGDGGRGPCQGDSGGPIACGYEGRYYLVGVVSWGQEDCMHENYPSVSSRVFAYRDWIEKYVT